MFAVLKLQIRSVYCAQGSDVEESETHPLTTQRFVTLFFMKSTVRTIENAETHCCGSVRPPSVQEAASQQEPCQASMFSQGLGGWLADVTGPAADLCVSCRKELAEAHKTNKPCGKCHFYLLISKTFEEAGKGNSKKKQSSQKKDELMFANAEEEFFYEVRRCCSLYLSRWNLWFSLQFSFCSHENVGS